MSPADDGRAHRTFRQSERLVGLMPESANPSRRRRARSAVPRRLLAVLAAAGLAVDAWVHAHLAPTYAAVRATVSQGQLFHLEAAVAGALAVLVLLRPTRRILLAAALTGAAGFAAVLLYRYVDVGRLGPVPNMYEPVWFPQKTASAVAEAASALFAMGALLMTRRRPAGAAPDPATVAATGSPGRRSRVGGTTALAALTLAVFALAAFVSPGSHRQSVQRPAAGAVLATTTVRAGEQRITVLADDELRFVPATFRAHPGTVVITLVDVGSYPHNISFPSLHLTSPSVSGDPGGTRTTLTVTFARPGRYGFICTYHSTAGMVGTVLVS